LDIHRRLGIGAALAVMLAHPLHAQSGDAVAFDATVGVSAGWGGSRLYTNQNAPAAEITLGIRPAEKSARMFALTVGSRGLVVGHGDLCRIAPPPAEQGCLPDYPAVTHMGLLFGLEQSRLGVTVRALAGPAFFGMGGGSGLGGQFQADAAAGFSHLAAVAAVRGSLIARFTGERLRLGSLEFGLRIR
jgi:hypothetical protein